MRIQLAIAAALLAAPALAQDDMMAMDGDGDGMLSMEEMTAANPDMTEDMFNQVDTNVDGMIDQAEYTAAVDAGTLPASGG